MHMARRGRGLVIGVLLVVGVLAVSRAQGGKGVNGEVLDLAKQSEAGKDVTKKAADLRERFGGIRQVMNLYNPRDRRGIGFGPHGIAIERKLIDLEENPLGADALKKEAADLTRVAHLNLVMAEITLGFAPPKPVLGKGKKEWQRDVDALKAGSRSLLKAIASSSPKDVRAAAARINTACNNCHDGK
jgi:hypothetical protein